MDFEENLKKSVGSKEGWEIKITEVDPIKGANTLSLCPQFSQFFMSKEEIKKQFVNSRDNGGTIIFPEDLQLMKHNI